MWLERGGLSGLVLLLAVGSAAMAGNRPVNDRVVVAGGGLTEILYALGVEDHIVGVDTTSSWPPAARDKPQVGYLRGLAAEGILSLSPTLVIATDEAGPPPVLALLEASGVVVRTLPAPHSAADIERSIRTLAGWFDRQAAGEALIQGMKKALAQATRDVSRYPGHPRVLFVLQAGSRLLAAGRGTAADAMIDLAGGRNVAAFDGYKPLSPEAAAHLAPEVILAPEHVVQALGGPHELLAQPALALTPAGREGRLVVMPAERLLTFGPRLGQTVSELAQRLHAAEAP